MTAIDLPSETRDAGRIRLGAAFRLAPTVAPALPPSLPAMRDTPAAVADPARIRLGAAFRLLARG
jgi:hypothetical protein